MLKKFMNSCGRWAKQVLKTQRADKETHGEGTEKCSGGDIEMYRGKRNAKISKLATQVKKDSEIYVHRGKRVFDGTVQANKNSFAGTFPGK